MFPSIKKQQGSMIIIAVFIIVVVSLLATNLTRIKWSNQDTSTREVLGTQAWFLANSSIEWALTQLYPIGEKTPDLANNCKLIRDDENSNTTNAVADLADGLPCENPIVRCFSSKPSLPNDLKYYRVTSSAVCGSGTFKVQREQEIWIKSVAE